MKHFSNTSFIKINYCGIYRPKYTCKKYLIDEKNNNFKTWYKLSLK